MTSPYKGLTSDRWPAKTKQLINEHPLDKEILVEAVLESWNGILGTRIAGALQVGEDIFPQPQVMGNMLHELIPVILADKTGGRWKRGSFKGEKDVINLFDSKYSFEIKTSSSYNNIYGNASYGSEDRSDDSSKEKSGYYLTVNFEKFDPEHPETKPKIRKIRFGWIDADDWHSQKASSGQQAYIRPEVREGKLITLYKAD